MIEALLERDRLPDGLIRLGIRRIVAARLAEQRDGGLEAQSERQASLLAELRRGPIAVSTDSANAQHYEVPPGFFQCMLGPHMKYSCGWWPAGVDSLAAAELQMLALTGRRATLADGQRILDLGCGWGSFALFAAETLPNSRVVAVSNSSLQREFIQRRARDRGLANLAVTTADINEFEPGERFDRIVAVEMLEHVRNHAALFGRVASWLAPGGQFFAHVFAHRRFAYLFEDRGPSDWMARHFFTGGMMPSDDWFLRVQDHLVVDDHWRLDGRHYQRTAEAWLANLDRRRTEVDTILGAVYGPAEATLRRVRWRVFLMACAEMFGFDGGQEWMVSHYRFRKRHDSC